MKMIPIAFLVKRLGVAFRDSPSGVPTVSYLVFLNPILG